MRLLLREKQPSPWRGEIVAGAMRFPVRKSTVRELGLAPGEEIEMEESDLLSLRTQEKAGFFALFTIALAAKERSPVWARNWCRTRFLGDEWTEEFLESARAESYLSEKRYATHRLVEGERKGNKPLWILRREIRNQGVDAPTLSGLPENEGFDEEAALLRLLDGRYRRETRVDTLRRRLVLRGFAESLVRRVLAKRFGADPGVSEHGQPET